MARKLIVEIVADSSGYTRGIAGAERATEAFTGTVKGLSLGLGTLAKSFVVLEVFNKAFEGLTEAVHSGIGEFRESTQIQAQTVAALKSTGDVSGKTADQIHGLSLELSNLSGQSDESIQSAENVLLSFTNIRDSLGKNNDVFTRATQTVVDFSARTGRDAPAAAVLLGKALQDPAKRVGILARAGVVLTASQTEYLKKVEAGQGILAAQKILLGDLATRFSGAAAAAGKTLPGALDILKERFRDLAGEGVGAVAPALTSAVNGLAGFVVKLTEAHGAAAKLHIVTAGLKNLGRQVFDTIKGGFEQIDWSKLFDRIGDIAGSLLSSIQAQVQRVDWTQLARTIGDRIKAVNWRAVIQDAATGLTTAVTGLLNTLTRALQAVDWEKVGKTIADGLALAVGAVAKFLADVDWSKVIRALVRGLAAAADAAGALFEGISKEIGQFILAGLEKGLDAAGRSLEATALRIALKIVEPFTHLPQFLGGGTFQDLQKTMQTQLQSLGTEGQTFAQQAAHQTAQGFVTQLQSEQATVVKTFQDFFGSVTGLKLPDVVSGTGSAPTTAQPYKPAGADIGAGAGGGGRKGVSQSQRNTFFDNMIGRLLDQAQDGTIQQQITKLKAVGGLITARIAATRDVTRRLTLEQTLLDQVTRPLQADRQQQVDAAKQAAQTARENTVAAAQLAIARAQAVPGYENDLATQKRLVEILRNQLAADRTNVDLQHQLFDAEQAVKSTLKARADQAAQAKIDAGNLAIQRALLTDSLADDLAATQKQVGILQAQHASESDIVAAQLAAKSVRDQNQQAVADAFQARQYQALGLLPSGDEPIFLTALQKQLRQVRSAVKGTTLDTKETRKQLEEVGNVLSLKFGVPLYTTGQKIQSMLQGITDKLKDLHGQVTKFRHISSTAFVDSLGLNLNRDQRRALEARFAVVGAGGTVAAGRSGQFTGGVTVHGDIHVHGVQDIAAMENEITKRANARAHTRRGA